MIIRTHLFILGTFCSVAVLHVAPYAAVYSQSARPISSDSAQRDFRPSYDEKSMRMISDKLAKLIAQKACISRLKLGISNSSALAASRTEVLQSYPNLAASIPPITLKSLEPQYKKACKPLFQKEIVLQLPKDAIPKPITVHDFANPASCRVDTYWLNRLMSTSRLYLENKQCLFDVQR